MLFSVLVKVGGTELETLHRTFFLNCLELPKYFSLDPLPFPK